MNTPQGYVATMSTPDEISVTGAPSGTLEDAMNDAILKIFA